MNENQIGTIILDCAVMLHRNLGPGLLESVYEVTLARTLERRSLRAERRVGIAMREGTTQTIKGYLDSGPPCLGASVREDFNPKASLGDSPLPHPA